MTERAVTNTRARQRTTAEWYEGLFRSAAVMLYVGLAMAVVWYILWGRQAANQTGYQQGKRVGHEEGQAIGYDKGLSQGNEEGKQLGRNEGIGKARPLTGLERYRFHGEFLIAKKRYALLVPPDSLEPRLYELDARQFPTGFPPIGGILQPVEVDGYFKPIDPNEPRVSKVKRARAAKRPTSTTDTGVITRRSSRARLPQDWPMEFPALPSVNPQVFKNN